MEEAKLVCKELGFPRGVRSTTQGLVHGNVNENRKITENVECDGDENSLKKCRIRYHVLRNILKRFDFSLAIHFPQIH